eukprot:11179008-Lingulodinium_polyedra.AAC.1
MARPPISALANTTSANARADDGHSARQTVLWPPRQCAAPGFEATRRARQRAAPREGAPGRSARPRRN